MRRRGLLAVLLLLVSLIVPASGAGAASTCTTPWGSLVESAPRAPTAPLVDVRTGRHACFDRLVLETRGTMGGYTVRYVWKVRHDASGQIIPTRGGARIQVTITGPAYDSKGNPTYVPANPRELTNVTGYSTFRQVVWAGSFEGYTSIGLGVRARLPFRVFVLAGPGTHARLVIDVAHHW